MLSYEFNLLVTKDHVNRGIRQSSVRCPIALALKDAFSARVIVHGRSISFQGLPYSDLIDVLRLPERTSTAIMAFDVFGSMIPGHYKVLIPYYIQPRLRLALPAAPTTVDIVQEAAEEERELVPA